MKKYCQKCGHPNEYGLQGAPNFCESCGNAFGQQVASNSNTAAAPTVITSSPKISNRYVLSEEDDTPIPNITKLEVTIEGVSAPKLTIEAAAKGEDINVMGTRPRGTKFNYADVKQDFDRQFSRDRTSTQEEVS